jgi:hypothetical protein
MRGSLVMSFYDELEKHRVIIERLLGGLKDLHALRVRLSTFDANSLIPLRANHLFSGFMSFMSTSIGMHLVTTPSCSKV